MIDSNTIVSLYAKSSSLQQLSKALNDEANGTISLFYWNKKEAVSLMQTSGLQLPGSPQKEGFVHSIRENGSSVNIKIKNVTYSKQFKRWFGDWRANDTTKVNTVFVDTKANNISRGVFKNKDTNWEINVSSVGIGDTISHSGKEKLSVLALNNIDIIIQNAILLDSEVSTQTGKKGANTIFMHKLYVPTNIGGKSYISKVSVEEYSSGNDTNKRFYNLKEIKISPALGGLSTNNTASTMRISDDNISISELFDIVKTSDKNFSPKPVNPVFLNDDGTPKVVYHGTDADFNVFKSDDGNFWFSESREKKANCVVECYLNMRNPYYTKLEPNQFSKSDYERRIIKEARKNGFDGIIIENNAKDEYSTEKFYVVFNPTQIKSATDNIGTFDKNNPDIRYSKILGNGDSITKKDVEAVQSIGRKSVNDFTGEDIKKSDAFARRYFKEMGVKSPFFRAWFGDWRVAQSKERAPYINILKTVKPISSTDGAEIIKNSIKSGELFRGDVINKDTGIKINVGRHVYEDTLTYANRALSRNKDLNMYASKLSLLYNLEEIVEESIMLDTESIADKNKNSNRTFIHKFYSFANVDNKPYIVKLSVDELNSDGATVRRAYNVTDIEISPIAVSRFFSPAGTMSDIGDMVSIPMISDLFSLVKQYDKEFNPTPANPLLLNNDGTPKVFYHGTSSNDNFTVFDTYGSYKHSD